MRTAVSLVVTSILWVSVACSQDDLVERMEREHATDSPVASPAAEAEPAAPTTGSQVHYATIGDVSVRGYLARPAGSEATAGVLLIHEWWGLNDNIRAVADRLAAEGYLALAVDLYEGNVATDRESAAGLMRGTLERARELEDNLAQARRFLADAGARSVGVVGWCFGGGWSLRAAVALGDGIDAAVIYYGRLVTNPAELETLSAPVLGLFGALDQGIPIESVRDFEAALAALEHPASIHVYPGADHAFANPTGTRYNAAAAEDAWAKTLAFLAENLR